MTYSVLKVPLNPNQPTNQPSILSIDFNLRLDEEQLPSFTQWLTMCQTWLIRSIWVTDSRMLCCLPRSCVVHPVDHFDSEGCFSSDWVICFMFFGKKHAAFKWKDAISGFPVSSGSAEAIFRWGGKITHVWLPTFSATYMPKIVAIEPWM